MELGLKAVKPRDGDEVVLLDSPDDCVAAFALYASTADEVKQHASVNNFNPRKNSVLDLSSQAITRFISDSPKYKMLKGWMAKKHTDFFNNYDSPGQGGELRHSSYIEREVKWHWHVFKTERLQAFVVS